ncbi:MAG: DNA alkylation repair protein [Calditrichaceae bacterium]|nr:DNA alkylation repair protein [Calditrichaceae bacterium]MBN2709514.1 DNA alkylation repair protein [Calditrichaceae bacterium]RQV93122.1 MAG: DNA alkylation repair protein [Calditrichota bacterium]
MENLIIQIRNALIDKSDEQTKKSGKRFFKDNVKLYGVKSENVKKLSKEFFIKIKDKSKAEIFNICEKLWQSGIIEESIIACIWSHKLVKQYSKGDFVVFERWIDQYVNNWATCDTLCNHTIGDFLQLYPEYIENLKIWAKSDNRWMRRASAVSLIIPAKKGLFIEHIFEIADILLVDKEDLVQKGYGWMLKSSCNKYEKDVFNYVMNRKDRMPRTALRYAIEKMPKEMRRQAMEK